MLYKKKIQTLLPFKVQETNEKLKKKEGEKKNLLMYWGHFFKERLREKERKKFFSTIMITIRI